MSFESIYQRMPVFAQDIACSLYGYKLNRRRYGGDYKAIEDQVFQRAHLNKDGVEEIQRDRLRRIIKHAVETVPYYRKKFSELGISAEDIQCKADLKILPVLTKDVVQANLKEFYSEALDRKQVSIWKTSGTTGTSLVFPMTLSAEQEQWAVWWRYRSQFGIDHTTWYAHFYGKTIVPLTQQSPPFWRINYPGRQILFSAYHMNYKNMESYIRELNKRRPPWVQGYPSLLSTLAEYIVSTGNELIYKPEVVTVGAESLLPNQKKIIELAFGTRCRQHYGTTEAVANISECTEGRLHVDEDFGLIEFVKDEGDAYKLIATGLANEAFILLRYQVGDTVALPTAGTNCTCGLPGRIVESIDGRIEDYVITPKGARIGRLDHILKDMLTIRECQIVQEKNDAVQFRVVRGMEYSTKDEEKLRFEAAKRLGEDMHIDIVYVDELERTSRGKLRFVVSRMKESQIQ